jgi:hypothetical protein
MVPVLGKVRRRVIVGLSFVAFAAIALSAGWSQASAAPQAQSSSSDARARLVGGNVTTCAGVGFASDVQIGSSSNGNAGDAHVAGIVKTNAGMTHQGQGQELDVVTIGTGFVVDAVVVKGGPAYNLYTSPSVLPPILGPDQHFISPLNHGGNVPTISHWFVCYRGAPSPTTTAATTTTTVKVTTKTSPPSPPITQHTTVTTIPSTATTSTTEAKHVPIRGTPTPHSTAKAPPTTRPSTTTVAATAPPHTTTTVVMTPAFVSLPDSGASTASFVVGCATAILGLVVLALRPRA